MRTVICPGSFDPITNGHMDIIRRASGLFDRVIVVVAYNVEKHGYFTPQERHDMIVKAVSHERGMDNVSVELWSGLLVNCVRENKACAIVKGLRAVSDFEYEFQMALTNSNLLPGCETIFLTPAAQNMYLSSNIVRQVAGLGGEIEAFVPECILADIKSKLFVAQ